MISIGRLMVLADRVGGKCVGAPATRDEERNMAVELLRLRVVEAAAREVLTISLNDAGPEAFRSMAALREATEGRSNEGPVKP